MRKLALFMIFLMIFITACDQAGSGDTTAGTASSAFLGGSSGIVPEFVESSPPPEVYDGGQFPFDVVVKLTNKGEYSVAAPRVRVTLSGILANEFGVPQSFLSKGPVEDVIGRQQDAEGNILEPAPVFVEFLDLNHRSPIVSSIQRFPLQASVCSLYGTVATSTLCSRDDILNPRGPSICEINEDKTVENSGAPVQVSSLRQSARAFDKIGFTFKVVHTGQGDIYQQGSNCNRLDRRFEDRVRVRVASGIPGLSCTGLSGGVEGEVTLFGGEKTITCTQQLPTPADFEFPVTIDLLYDYEERTTTEIVVKRSETVRR